MTDPCDMSGVWYGRYASRAEPQENSFIAVLEEAPGGGFTGTISEPDGGGGIRRALVNGQRTGMAIYFVKQYTGRWDHKVNYSGRIDGEGVTASGGWNLDWLWGNFDMQREKFRVEELEDDIEVVIGGPGPQT